MTTMIWTARYADADTVARLRADPSGIGAFVSGFDVDEALLDAPAEVHNPAIPFDLDEQWQAIHHLLTGSAGATDDALSVIVGKFPKIGKDQGFGAAWLIPAGAIIDANEALEAVSNAELRKRYDPKAMVADGVYGAKLLLEDGEGGLDFVIDDVDRLRSFLREGAKRKLAAFAMIN
ncbi:MAG: DUF1877 family protein [Sphingomonadales bacterium]|nr:DUF1877 family protein [Sphingomonadales bacterium]MDE2570467.1 DUF1877 family protein [Sphingomonadales bacterium]